MIVSRESFYLPVHLAESLFKHILMFFFSYFSSIFPEQCYFFTNLKPWIEIPVFFQYNKTDMGFAMRL